MERGWFIDAWRSGEMIACWIKTERGDVVRRYPHTATVYARPYPSIVRWLERTGRAYECVVKRDYAEREHRLVAIRAPIARFERFVRELERAGRYTTPLFDADLAPEERFVIERGLWGGCPVGFDETRIEPREGAELPALRVRRYSIELDRPLRVAGARVHSIGGDVDARGDERAVLEALARDLERTDPDALVIDHAFATLPVVDERMRALGIATRIHRSDDTPIRSRGGRSMFRYGAVVWRDFAVRIRGRLLFDAASSIGGAGDVEGLVELSRLSGASLGKIASRSPGAVFQHAIVRDLVTNGKVVALKSKPLPEPLSMRELALSDRAGLSFDPLIGFHTDVIELDYEAMFPTLMVLKNISAEKIGRGERAPDVPVRVDQEGESIVARCMRPFVELRSRYKHSENPRERARAKALKGVLVSANGYLRFREFKLGMPTSHVALCAWAREHLLRAKEEGEAAGYRLVHGIVDGVYLQGDTRGEAIEALQRRIEARTGLHIEHEGTFRWIVFLPSKQDPQRPVVTRFFGVHTDGSVKLRGIEARQRSTCELTRRVQHAIVEHLGSFRTETQIRVAIPALFDDLSGIVARLDAVDRELLARSITLSKADYARDTIQRRVLAAARARGVPLEPGQRVSYVLTLHGPEPVSGSAPIDTAAYRRLLVRAVSTITAPFGYPENAVALRVRGTGQRTLARFETRTGPLEPLIGTIDAHGSHHT